MDVAWQYLLSAAAGGVLGGLGHAVISPNPGFGLANKSDTRDFSGFRDLAVGFFSGVVWLLTNQNNWSNNDPGPRGLLLIALQTLVIGLAGSGWLTAHLDATTLKGAVAEAAGAQKDPAVANQISQAKSVSQIMDLVKTLKAG